MLPTSSFWSSRPTRRIGAGLSVPDISRAFLWQIEAVIFVILALIWRLPRRPGVIGSWFLIIYGALRFITEHWRLPDDHLTVQTILGLTRGQWFSVIMIVIGVVMLTLVIPKRNDSPIGGWGRRAEPASTPEHNS